MTRLEFLTGIPLAALGWWKQRAENKEKPKLVSIRTLNSGTIIKVWGYRNFILKHGTYAGFNTACSPHNGNITLIGVPINSGDVEYLASATKVVDSFYKTYKEI